MHKYVTIGKRPHAQITYKNAKAIYKTAPIHSHRHDRTSISTMRNVGIKCIKRASRVFQRPLPSSNTSRAKIEVKSAKRTVRTRGAQMIICFVVFFISYPLILFEWSKLDKEMSQYADFNFTLKSIATAHHVAQWHHYFLNSAYKSAPAGSFQYNCNIFLLTVNLNSRVPISPVGAVNVNSK